MTDIGEEGITTPVVVYESPGYKLSTCTRIEKMLHYKDVYLQRIYRTKVWEQEEPRRRSISLDPLCRLVGRPGWTRAGMGPWLGHLCTSAANVGLTRAHGSNSGKKKGEENQRTIQKYITTANEMRAGTLCYW